MPDLGSRKAYFVSDIHLERDWGRNGEILLRFFDRLIDGAEKESCLFLVGDIFDVWVSDHKFFSDSFEPFVTRIHQISELMPVYYFEGNHDFHIKKFWSNYGVEVIADSETFSCQRKVLRVEHGDFINPEDKAYMKWRSTARGPLFTFLAHTIPGRGWQWIADYWISNNKKIRENNPLDNEETVRQMIRKYAEENAEKFDILITGHMHVRDEYEFSSQGKDKLSINLGTWLKQPCCFVLSDGVGYFEDLV